MMMEQHVNLYFRSILGTFIFYSTFLKVEMQEDFSVFSTSPDHVIYLHLFKTVRSVRDSPCLIHLSLCTSHLREVKWNGLFWIVGGPSLPMERPWKTASVLKTHCNEALNHVQVVTHLKWGGDRNTLDAVPGHCSFQARLLLHCVSHSVKYQSTPTGQHPIFGIDTGTRSILHHPSVFNQYTVAKDVPLEERQLKLSMHYYLKISACTDNPTYHALHEFDRATRDVYVPRPNGRRGMTWPQTLPLVSR